MRFRMRGANRRGVGRRLTCLLAILSAWGQVACGTQGSGFFISDAKEAEIGAEVHQEVLLQYPLFVDATGTVDAWALDLGGQLASASEVVRDGVDYQFFVLDTDIVNAFAAPGGYIYLTCGLILQAETEAEVASVLGHEVGHVAHRHSVAQIERAAALGLISDLIFGDSIPGDVVDFATSFVLGTSYSQDQETDADDLGVVFTYEAGINPWGMVDFFNTLAQLSGDSIVPDWLSSHPQPADRAAHAEDNIAALGDEVTRESTDLVWERTGNFQAVQDVLNGQCTASPISTEAE